jgi:hypothetical protein
MLNYLGLKVSNAVKGSPVVFKESNISKAYSSFLATISATNTQSSTNLPTILSKKTYYCHCAVI